MALTKKQRGGRKLTKLKKLRSRYKKKHHLKKRNRKTRRFTRNIRGGGDIRSDLKKEIEELKKIKVLCRQNIDEKISQKTEALKATYSPRTQRRAKEIRDDISSRVRGNKLLDLNTLPS